MAKKFGVRATRKLDEDLGGSITNADSPALFSLKKPFTLFRFRSRPTRGNN